ncbi:hypothetical protein SprV_0501798400 [Sparganum proliferum]
MPALSPNISHANQPRRTSKDSVHQPNKSNRPALIPTSSTTTADLTADGQHPRARSRRSPPSTSSLPQLPRRRLQLSLSPPNKTLPTAKTPTIAAFISSDADPACAEWSITLSVTAPIPHIRQLTDSDSG